MSFVPPRSLVVLLSCLALLVARAMGLHFHVSDEHHHHEPGAWHQPHAGAAASVPTSDLAAAHLADHLAGDEQDAGSEAGVMAKLPVTALAVFLIVLWLAAATRMGTIRRLPVQWLRPPPGLSWPILLLPPSQGPPRAA